MESMVRVSPETELCVNEINSTGRKTILFLHGWPLNQKAYEYQYIELPYRGYRCLGMDTRGFGRSGKPFTGYTYDTLADDVRSVVDALKLEDFILAGHSMGGATAIRYMARYNGHGVQKLALFGAAAPSVTQRPDFPYGLTKESVTAMIRRGLNDRPSMLTDLSSQFFYQRLPQAFLSWFVSLGLEAAGWSTAQCAMTFRDAWLMDDLRKIGVPTLILHGRHDQVCPYPLAEAMHSVIKDSKLVPFEKSGHGLFYEERDKFNDELTFFIG
jgi:non-heme chloroperoxidase